MSWPRHRLTDELRGDLRTPPKKKTAIKMMKANAAIRPMSGELLFKKRASTPTTPAAMRMDREPKPAK